MSAPLVAILVGSKADLAVADRTSRVLADLGVAHTLDVLDPAAPPERTAAAVATATERGVEVFVVGAAGASPLPAVVAACTARPVVGLPIRTAPLGGADALYATVQAPVGVPIATVGIDAADNAGLLAARILAAAHPEVAEAVDRDREERAAAEPEHRDVAPSRSEGGLGFGFQPG